MPVFTGACQLDQDYKSLNELIALSEVIGYLRAEPIQSPLSLGNVSRQSNMGVNPLWIAELSSIRDDKKNQLFDRIRDLKQPQSAPNQHASME